MITSVRFCILTSQLVFVFFCKVLCNADETYDNYQSPVFYQFGYQVNDQDKYFGHNYQGHMEHVDGHTTTGEFKVKLPDGRLQITSYLADDDGYRPKITYTYDDADVPMVAEKHYSAPGEIHQSSEMYTPPEVHAQAEGYAPPPKTYVPPPPEPEKYSPPSKSYVPPEPEKYSPPPSKYTPPEPAQLYSPPAAYSPPEKYAPPPPVAYTPPAPGHYSPPEISIPSETYLPPDNYVVPKSVYTPTTLYTPPDAYRPPDAYNPPDAYKPQDAYNPPDAYRAPDAYRPLAEYHSSSFESLPHNSLERRSQDVYHEEENPTSTRRSLVPEHLAKQMNSDQQYYLVSLNGNDANAKPVFAILAKKKN